MRIVAGHAFDDVNGTCTCGKRFSDIASAGPEHVDQEHWAHSGRLSSYELSQITAERERLWRTLFGAAPEGVAQAEDNSIFG